MYQKPRIKAKKVKINYFSWDIRFLDSYNGMGLENKLAIAGDGPPCDCGPDCDPCFIKDTKIALTNGKYKKIQKIKPGDSVWSYNIATGRVVKNTVENLLVHPDSGNGYYIINSVIKVTGNHHFWANDSVWERVDNLKLGDVILDLTNKKIAVKSIKKIKGVNTTYNFHTRKKHHNYFAENILVHNGSK